MSGRLRVPSLGIEALLVAAATSLAPGCGSLSPAYVTLAEHEQGPQDTPFGPTTLCSFPGTKSPLIVCVPGFPGSAIDFAELVGPLNAAGYPVLVLQPPGHGDDSPDADWHYRFDEYGRWLQDALARNGAGSPEKVCLVGHSAGCEMIVQAMMDAAGDGRTLASSVVFVNPWIPSFSNAQIPWSEADERAESRWPITTFLFGWTDGPDSWARLFSAPLAPAACDYQEARTWTLQFTECFHETTATQGETMAQGAAYSEQGRKRFESAAARLNVALPVLVLNSAWDLDQTIPTSYKFALEPELERMLPGAKRPSLPLAGGGHMLQVEQGEAVAARILEFLEKRR